MISDLSTKPNIPHKSLNLFRGKTQSESAHFLPFFRDFRDPFEIVSSLIRDRQLSLALVFRLFLIRLAKYLPFRVVSAHVITERSFTSLSRPFLCSFAMYFLFVCIPFVTFATTFYTHYLLIVNCILQQNENSSLTFAETLREKDKCTKVSEDGEKSSHRNRELVLYPGGRGQGTDHNLVFC